MEWTILPGGYVPFEHVHVCQDEIFHVEKGEIRARVNGKTLFGKTGESLMVPRGVRHIAYNDRDEKLVCIVDYKPGLDHYTTMQCLAGLTLDGMIGKNGLVDIPRVMYLLKRANVQSLPRPAFAPNFAFRLGMSVFYMFGGMLGWEDLYKKYTCK
jgi:oxalate decarboxylase/phosphoglucose isomerase-like protein (cupin superfamily)